MPKEKISSKYSDKLEETFLQVSWSREGGHVEVATIVPSGKLMAYDPETKTHQVLDVQSPGWFMQMDRGNINEAIKVLRKARDQTFGRDE